MEMQSKNRKPLIVGVIAAVVILAVLVVLLLTQCTGGQNAPGTTEATKTETKQELLYWNLDMAEYSGKSEAGMSSRMPAEDGFFYVRLFCEGEEVTVKVADRRIINTMDVNEVFGLSFGEDGVVTDVLDIDELDYWKAGWQFFVQSAAKTVIKLNSSESMDGMEVMLEGFDPDRVWDMSGKSGPVGSVCEPMAYDRIMAVQNTDGVTTHVYVYERPNYMTTHKAYCQHCDKEVDWYEWVKTDRAPGEAGHYQLQNDIKLTGSQVELPEECKLCLDLNGYRIDGREKYRVYAMRQAAADFAVMDTSEAQTGVIAAHGTVGQGAVVWPTKGAFYLYSGTIDASDVVTNIYGPAVSVSAGAYFYMNGGTVIGGTAQPVYKKDTGKYSGGYAGSIYCAGKFVLNDGVVCDGRAKAAVTYKDGNPTYNAGYGGNLVVGSGGVFEMNGGVIRGGKSDGNGGNIWSSSNACEITINGGSVQGGICYGKGKLGGNMYMGAKTVFTLNGGSIVGGVSYNMGGNIYTTGNMVMNSGYIGSGALVDFATGKKTQGDSFNVRVSNGQLTQWGGTIVGGVSIRDSSATDKYNTVLNLYGKAKIHGGENNRNLKIETSGGGVEVNVGTLRKGADIWVNASGIFTKPTKADNLQYFHSDVENVDVILYQDCLAMGQAGCICGASKTTTPDAHSVGCDGTILFWGPWTSKTSLPRSTGNYYLTNDVSLTNYVTVSTRGMDVKLDLNGHNITRNVSTDTYDGFQVYRVYYGNKVDITDTTAKSTGHCGTVKVQLPAADAQYTGGSFVVSGKEYSGDEAKAYVKDRWSKTLNWGMLLAAQGGHISVHNGFFDGSNLKGTQNGLVFYSTTGTFTDSKTGESTLYYGKIDIYGGTVLCGTAGSGGNLMARNGCAINVYGGTVTGGAASNIARTCIYAEASATLGLYGGKIDGGVYAAGAATLSGAPVVGSKNEGLTSVKPVVINGTLSDGASVYVSGTGFVSEKTVEANADNIHSIFDGMVVEYKDEKLYISRKSCLCNYAGNVHTAGCIAAMTDLGLTSEDKLEMKGLTAGNYTQMEDGGNWFLNGDLTIGDGKDGAAVSIKDGKKLVLDLNGKTLTVNKNGSVFTTQSALKGDAWIIITDTSVAQTGKIRLVGKSGGQGGIIRLWGRTSVNGAYVYAENNRVYLLAGTLDASGYQLTQAYGGAVEAHHKQTMYMYGGTIIGTNGFSQTERPDNGAAVRVNEGTFKMYAGTIYGGDAKNGSVLHCSSAGTFVMTGGTICGGVNIASNKVKIGGSAVIDKSLSPDGYVKPAYSLQIASDRVVDFAGLSGSIKVTASGKFGINGTEEIAKKLESEDSRSVVALSGTDLVMDWAKLNHCVCGNATHIGNCDGTSHEWTAHSDSTTLPVTSGYYYLTESVDLAENVKPEKNATIYIDLNGNSINLEGSKGEQVYKFTAKDNVRIVLTDSSAQKGAVILNGTGKINGGMLTISEGNHFEAYNITLNASAFSNGTAAHGSIAAPYRNASFSAFGCTILGGEGKQGGSIRMFYNAAVTIDGCTVQGGNATDAGGFIYSIGDANRASITIRNTVIDGCSSNKSGAILASSSTGLDIVLDNVEIKNCSANAGSGAISLTGSKTTLLIKGHTVITENTVNGAKNNIYITAQNGITIDSSFTGSIGINGSADKALIKNIADLNNPLIVNGNIHPDDPATIELVVVGGGLGLKAK